MAVKKAARPRKVKEVQDNTQDLKELGSKVDKMVKSFTKDLKSVGAKYGKIIDVKIAIEVSSDT
jgi:hypothetical protein